MMEDKKATCIGSISSCIAGDFRYATQVKVHLEEDGTVTIERLVNGAVGGMDGPGGAHGFRVEDSKVLKDPSPRDLVAAVWTMFDDVITTYGKPTKKFKWFVPSNGANIHPDAQGMSAAKARLALGK